MPASEAELRRFACDFRIPGEVMPMFVIGKPLATLARGAVASVRLIDGKLAGTNPGFGGTQVRQHFHGVIAGPIVDVEKAK